MRLKGIIAWVLLAALARASDPAPQDGDSIAQAKKDLSSIRGPQSPSDPASSLPSLQFKDLGPLPGAPTISLPKLSDQEKADALDPTKRKQGTGNWLVDAMEKKSDSRRDTGGRGRDDLLKADADILKEGERDGQLGASREKADPKEAAVSVYNPLDSFMGGWISAKDHDLLLGSTKVEPLPGVESGRGRNDLLPGLDLGASASAVESLINPAEVSGLSESAKPGPNPYVALFELSAAPQLKGFAAPEGLGPQSPGPADFSRGISSPGSSAREAEGGRSVIPDFAQPSDDDKYFKQMKKF